MKCQLLTTQANVGIRSTCNVLIWCYTVKLHRRKDITMDMRSNLCTAVITNIHMTLCEGKPISGTPRPERRSRDCLSAKACSILRQIILRQLKFEHIAALHNKKLSRSHLATYPIPPSSAAAEAIFATPSLRNHFVKCTKGQVADAGRNWLCSLAVPDAAPGPASGALSRHGARVSGPTAA